MDISLSLQQQQHHINQLLSTAAAGTGIVGDVDALLTPIQMAPVVRSESKPERNLWREEEMMQMLNLMLQVNAIEMLNDKTVKSEKVFRNIEALMHQCGFRKKSYMQIWTKWKFLKSTYMTSRRAGVVPKVIPYSIYQMLHKILSASPNVSNGAGTGGSSIDGETSDSNRLVIASVESAASMSNGAGKAANKIAPADGDGPKEADDDNAFGMAHPIFGFRLGLVKQEPVDASYENSTNNGTNSDDANANSSCSSSVHHHFQPEIKQEVVETESPSPPLRDAHRRLERETIRSSPVRTMICDETAPPKETRPLPPLRIAPFAKAPPINGHPPQRECSPPGLSLHSPRPQSHKHYTRQSQSHPIDNNSFIRPLLMPKSMQRPHQGNVITTTATSTPIRLPKDITIHHTRGANFGPTTSRLKQVPMRKLANYQAQHIETVVPDANSRIMLQQQKQPEFVMHHRNDEVASTSQAAAASAAGAAMAAPSRKRKRRLQLPYAEPSPAKMVRNYSQAKPSHSHTDNGRGQCRRSAGEEENDGGDEDDNSPPPKHTFQKTKQQPKKGHKAKKDDAGFEAALRDLGRSLRSIQRELIGDFFEKQMELAREEHEFQSQQDKLLMEAFEEQSQLIMKSAKKLLGIDIASLNKSDSEEKTEGKTDEEAKPEETKSGYEEQEENEDTKEDLLKESDQQNDRDNLPQMLSLQFDESSESEEDEEFNDREDRESEGSSQNTLDDPSELVSSELVEDNEQL